MRRCILLGCCLLAGCASHLKVYNAAGQLLPGYPVATPVTFIETGEYTKLTKGGACERVPYNITVTQPVGPPVFVNVDPAQLAKTGLDLKFQANGTAQEISLNTEPSGADMIKNAADAVKTIATVAGVAAAAPERTGGSVSVLPPCDAVPDPATVHRSKLSA